MLLLISFTSLLISAFLTFSNCETIPKSCESPIYCYGEILDRVQLAKLFEDGKIFVDLKMKYSVVTTQNNFKKLPNYPNPSKITLKTFVNDNFEEGDELRNWTLPDFNESPDFVKKIENEEVKKFTKELISIWPQLGKHVKKEVSENSDQYSLIPVPNGFIVPGGRFREYYYWDSYWIIDGLLINEMTTTAQGMIDNFISLVQRFGFVPNGGRVYYLQRSQPPLLTPMAYLYYKQTRNTTWLEANIDMLAKELLYWVNQTITIQKNFRTYTMAHYNAVSEGPRPESYREDVETANAYVNKSQKQELYVDLKSGAESGWDFSGRWIFDDNGGNQGPLSKIQTRRVVPVDLNAFLCGAFRDISELYNDIKKPKESAYWKDNYNQMKKAINDILWDETDGIWYDYDIKLDRHRRLFYPSGVTPLWSKCFDAEKGQELGKRVVEYFKKLGILEYLGGIPASDDNTNEQWDFPNAWPPLQDIVVRGFENSGYPLAQEEAKILAERWIKSNMIGYEEKGVMYEKYHAEMPGKYGQGGEYKVQSGFGWSNGVALRFIYDYYTVESKDNHSYQIKGCSLLFWSLIVILKVII
ncbi:hypothetical protein ILUMI_07642 [Ignelater luminosus]|uniref:Trehalase n=1 Tax=Ignelater luminosus TaxID=2038154 RepID=A0A8K0D7P1_IGNLU|nr:hypothetical protein ILUMI_07642 [Ignelater luminosus]